MTAQRFNHARFFVTALSLVLLTSLFSGCSMFGKKGSAQNDEVRFVVYGDSQFANKDIYDRLIHETNMLRPNFVIQVGDMIQGYTYDADIARAEWEIFKQQIAPLEVPFYPVPGNHDVVTPATELVYGEVWGTDKYIYSFDKGPVHCIVLDTYYGDQEDQIAAWQRQWLMEDLGRYAVENGGIGSKELEEKSIFIFMHSPIWSYDPDKKGYQDWKKIHDFIKDYPVKLVVGGHTHQFLHEEIDGINYLVMNSSGSMIQRNERAGFFHSMLHVSVTKGNDIKYAVVKAGSVLPLDTVNNEERETLFDYDVPGGVLRVAEWQEGKPFEGTLTVPISNNLEVDRDYQYRWNLPKDSNVTVDPVMGWETVPAGETVVAEFQVSTPDAPGPGNQPHLTLSATNEIRTGHVSREWEKRYREEGIPTNLKLSDKQTWSGDWKLFVPPKAFAKPLQGSIVIDGKIDEAAWENDDPITDIGPINGEPAAAETKVTVLYDDDYLYVAGWMEEPNVSGMTASAGGDIPLTWSDDDFELFVDPENDQVSYNRIFENFKGTRFNATTLLDKTGRNNSYFHKESTYESATHVDEDYWSIEMRIPWDELGAEKPGTQGDLWGFQIGRHRTQSDPARWCWSANGLYNSRLWGLLEFQ